jgi:ADP-heptose:LPS heptosyltransferase
LGAKLQNAWWALQFLIRHGRPGGRVYRFGGGLGDHLLVSTVFRELKVRGIDGSWMLSDHPEVFEGNPHIARIVPDEWRSKKLCTRLGSLPNTLSYGRWIGDPDRIEPPVKHIIAEILERAGITGKVDLRPYFHAVETLPPEKHLSSRTICIQGANTAASTPMGNKQWHASRFAEVGELLGHDYDLVQLGLPGESDIPAARDMRGRLTIRQTAEALAEARFFIGQVGFLMHMTRAVGTRSIIVYGGREKASQSGYPCNENLEKSPDCSPCWRNNGCENNRQCLDDITTANLIEAVQRMERRVADPLETESLTLETWKPL